MSLIPKTGSKIRKTGQWNTSGVNPTVVFAWSYGCCSRNLTWSMRHQKTIEIHRNTTSSFTILLVHVIYNGGFNHFKLHFSGQFRSALGFGRSRETKYCAFQKNRIRDATANKNTKACGFFAFKKNLVSCRYIHLILKYHPNKALETWKEYTEVFSFLLDAECPRAKIFQPNSGWFYGHDLSTENFHVNAIPKSSELEIQNLYRMILPNLTF